MSWFGALKGSKQKTVQTVKQKPTPPKLLRRPETPVGTKPMRRVADETAAEDAFEQLPKECMCNLAKCRRKAKMGCILFSARICSYHHSNVTGRRRRRRDGRRGMSAQDIHHFIPGKCEDGAWVNDDGTPWTYTNRIGDIK